MATVRCMDGNEAVAAVAHRLSDVCSIYPITPASSVRQLRGSVAGHTAADPSAFERAQYQRVLQSWTP